MLAGKALPEAGMACLWDSGKLLQPAHFHQHPPLNEAILTEDVPQASHLAAIAPVACNSSGISVHSAACCAALGLQAATTECSL